MAHVLHESACEWLYLISSDICKSDSVCIGCLRVCARACTHTEHSFPFPPSAETARRLYARVESSVPSQDVRLAAREGLFLLQGKQFSYERERLRERDDRKRVLERKSLGVAGYNAELGYKVGDFVKLSKLAEKMTRFDGLVGEVRVWCV